MCSHTFLSIAYLNYRYVYLACALDFANIPKFIIQADFVLAANREAVPDTDWNQALRLGVAATFARAVLSFVAYDEPLRFHWMHYLPKSHIEGFWEPLRRDIADQLTNLEILVSRMGTLRLLSDARFLPSWYLHDGEPLLPDTHDKYLSTSYLEADITILMGLGLKKLNAKEMVARLKWSLRQGVTLSVLNKPLNDDWHTTFTNFIGKLLSKEAIKNEIMQLTIIPLSDGRWVSSASMTYSKVYLPYLVEEDSVKIQLPNNLGLNKLHTTAASVGERISLYAKLGICQCIHEVVISKIFDAHRNSCQGTLDDFVTHFEILFWFGKPSSTGFGSSLLAVSDKVMQHRAPTLFFPSDEEYHAQRLLARSPPEDFKGFGFLHPMYMNSSVRNVIRYQNDWKSWLQARGISYYPPLTEGLLFSASLSPALKLVARDNADVFVANLEAHWTEYRSSAIWITDQVCDLPVPCCDGTKKPLKSTFLPSQQVIAKSRDLEVELPFLKLPDQSFAGDSDKWSFLEKFGVICKVDSRFYLAVLRLLRAANRPSPSQMLTCSKIYAGIAECSKIGDAPTLLVS
jgi:hypothetical protein